MTERNYAAEVLDDLQAGDAPNISVAERAADELDRLRALNAELVAVCRALVERYAPHGSPSEGTNRIYTMAVRAIAKAERQS